MFFFNKMAVCHYYSTKGAPTHHLKPCLMSKALSKVKPAGTDTDPHLANCPTLHCPLGRVGLVVTESVCLCVPFPCNFFRPLIGPLITWSVWGLSLALWSHAQLEASHWSTPPPDPPPWKKTKKTCNLFKLVLVLLSHPSRELVSPVCGIFTQPWPLGQAESWYWSVCVSVCVSVCPHIFFSS